jgi:GT2 family glycosyltransferase
MGVRRSLPALRVLSADDVRGAGSARYRGICVARGDFLLFLDADDVIAPAYVEVMATALDQHDFVCCSTRLRKAEAHIGDRRCAAVPSHASQHALGRVPDRDGGSLEVRRKIALQVGGFDVDLSKGQDVDFCWRVQREGFPLHPVSHAVVHSRYRSTLGDIFRQARGIGAVGPNLNRKHGRSGMGRRMVGEIIRFWLAPLAQIRARVLFL